ERARRDSSRRRSLSSQALAVVSGALLLIAQPGEVRAQAPSGATRKADPRVEGRERFERGIDLFQQGDYPGGLAEIKRADELAPYAVVAYNLGLTYAALGRPVEAADAMARVLANPGSLSAERIERARAVQRDQTARIAELTVECSVEGATIDVDGVE